MAVTDPFANVALYRASSGKTDPGADAEILRGLTTITRYLQKRLGRSFTKDAAAVARIFVPKSRNRSPVEGWAEAENPWKASGASRVLYVDDLVSVSALEIDTNRDGTYATDLSASDYELTPRNAAVGAEPGPYTAIELTSNGSQWAWSPGINVKVTGIWGWPSVPEPIVAGCIEITRILRLESPRAFNTVADFGVANITNAQARNLVEELVQHYSKVSL